MVIVTHIVWQKCKSRIISTGVKGDTCTCWHNHTLVHNSVKKNCIEELTAECVVNVQAAHCPDVLVFRYTTVLSTVMVLDCVAYPATA